MGYQPCAGSPCTCVMRVHRMSVLLRVHPLSTHVATATTTLSLLVLTQPESILPVTTVPTAPSANIIG